MVPSRITRIKLDKDPAKGDALECATCFKVTHRNGETEFRHTAAVASLEYPDVAETIPIGVEPLTKRDRRAERPTAASDKQDCELAATKRLLDRLFHDQYGSRFIFVGDALYANAPMIQHVESAGRRYLCRVKSSQRKHLFEQLDAAAQALSIDTFSLQLGDIFVTLFNVPIPSHRWRVGRSLATGDAPTTHGAEAYTRCAP